MISVALWFALLSSGSVLCTAVWKRKFEEILPITCSVIVMILFLCGIAGSLLTGAVLVCVFGCAAYLVAMAWIIRKKELESFMNNLFTAGFWGFAIIFVCVLYFNYGKLADSWDEFSHWADIVKVMATLDDFGTNPEAHSSYQSYPPGMSLFQYFFQKLYMWTRLTGFCEWRLYSAYQMFAFAFMIPFLEDCSTKKPIKATVSLIVLFLSPLLFYQSIYTTIYIDPFLGILSGTGLATVLLSRNKDVFYSLRVLLTVAMLVLAKDAGMLFAVFLAVVYVLDYVHENKVENGSLKNQFLKHRLCILTALFAIGVPKCLWKWHLKVTNASVLFSAPYDVTKLLKIVTGQETGWQRTVWLEYYKNLIIYTITVGNTNIKINYLTLLFLLVGMVSVLCLLYGKKDESYRWKNRMIVGCVCILYVVYVVGLCVTYIFRFTEYEATRFASFTRYIFIVYLAVWLFCVLVFLKLLQEFVNYSPAVEILTIAVIMLVSPLEYVYNYVHGAYVDSSVSFRAQYTQLCDEIAEVQEMSRIYFISQESDGLDLEVVKYSARPNFVDASCSWSIGEAFYEGDIWTGTITAQEWQKELMDSYDYVALYKVNEYFIQNFGLLFQHQDEINNNSLFKINKETGLLEKCGE